MQDDLFETVKHAIDDSRVARDAFTSAMYDTSEKLGYTDTGDRDPHEKQIFGDPAGEDAINKLEAELKTSLPPSYRTFLLINDGWEVIDGSQSFFSIAQLLAWRERDDPSEWIAIAKQYENEFVEDCLVVGASDDSPDKYLLDPSNIDEQNEWKFVEYSKDGYEVYSSFLQYLIATKVQFEESASEVDIDNYFDPFDDE